ncbi:hypothetical protein MuYL_0710 [Mucilaginibacter xinganensis]|uniref:Uncharacterized protein n=1 Tax=Mucilaginibacter xinganensis TaxID=1234841 RepID=A0A223NRU7_9SPHI|nr:hypothetical protein MuYL_0710 [Mucilaginibacter xinganensis]
MINKNLENNKAYHYDSVIIIMIGFNLSIFLISDLAGYLLPFKTCCPATA